MHGTVLSRIKELCRQKYPEHNLNGHLLPTVAIALRLADKYNAEKQIVEAGAYLHDIARVMAGKNKYLGAFHDITGSMYSAVLLLYYGCGLSETIKISRCVLTHGNRFRPRSLEEEVVMNADAISHLEGYKYLLEIRAVHHPYESAEDVRKWVLRKLENSWSSKITLEGIKEELGRLYDRIKIEIGEQR